METTALYRQVSSFPDVREDLAVIVPEPVTAEELIDAVRGAGRPLLSQVEVFDVYRDPGKLGEGNKSLALRLECTVEELIRTIHAHPTMSEAVGEAAHAAHGAAIHA